MSTQILKLFLITLTASSIVVAAPNYKVDKGFKGTDKSGVIYMGVLPNDDICILRGKKVQIIDSKGKAVGGFDLAMEGMPSAIATDDKGKIIVISTKTKIAERKVRGKVYKYAVPIGVACTVFDKSGKKVRDIKIPDAKAAKAARVIKDRLVLADGGQRAILVVDYKTGKLKAKIQKGIRICCGIFDFCEGPNDSIVFANLGAFKVQSYSITGKPTKSFGKRGKEQEQFHGCCNPVSVAYLSNGYLVTAEKDTTRVKIYDKSLKKAYAIEGIGELVKGCSHIPMVADSKGNVYLASRRKGIIKCVPGV